MLLSALITAAEQLPADAMTMAVKNSGSRLLQLVWVDQTSGATSAIGELAANGGSLDVNTFVGHAFELYDGAERVDALTAARGVTEYTALSGRVCGAERALQVSYMYKNNVLERLVFSTGTELDRPLDADWIMQSLAAAAECTDACSPVMRSLLLQLATLAVDRTAIRVSQRQERREELAAEMQQATAWCDRYAAHAREQRFPREYGFFRKCCLQYRLSGGVPQYDACVSDAVREKHWPSAQQRPVDHFVPGLDAKPVWGVAEASPTMRAAMEALAAAFDALRGEAAAAVRLAQAGPGARELAAQAGGRFAMVVTSTIYDAGEWDELIVIEVQQPPPRASSAHRCTTLHTDRSCVALPPPTSGRQARPARVRAASGAVRRPGAAPAAHARGGLIEQSGAERSRAERSGAEHRAAQRLSHTRRRARWRGCMRPSSAPSCPVSDPGRTSCRTAAARTTGARARPKRRSSAQRCGVL